MSLVTLNIEPGALKRLIAIAERIADALERAYPPPTLHGNVKPAGPENLSVFDPEAEWQKQQEEDRLNEQGRPL